MRRIFLGLLLTLPTALPLAADSDGYYCVGPNYVAMEFRSFNTPGLAGPHVLRVLRFEEGQGARWSGEVIVENFQTHTLICDPTSIIFEGAGDPGERWVSYSVALDLAGAPRIASHTNNAPPFPAKEPPNLGTWARPGVIPLPLERLSSHFQLRITEMSSRDGNQIRHAKRTVLEEMDDRGRVIRSLPISEGTLYESTGG
jgi:hypothetical protein